MSFIFKMMLVLYQSVSLCGSISNIYWHANKWSSISFSHWQCPSDRVFSFPRFVGLLILTLWYVPNTLYITLSRMTFTYTTKIVGYEWQGLITWTLESTPYIILPIDLVLIDQQSVGKRSLHLMDTVNAKKRWTTIYCRVNKFLKEGHIVTKHAKERVSLLKINDI
jgi:hypothetical protein